MPHYAHLFGQQSAKRALQNQSLTIDIAHVEKALPSCTGETAQTIREKYHKATISPRAGNIYKEVLLAAALTQVDELGYFPPVGLRRTLAQLLKRDDAPVSLYGQHLKVLCEDERGKILEQTGTSRKYRYRFPEPMMQPFILMVGLANKLITREQIAILPLLTMRRGFPASFSRLFGDLRFSAASIALRLGRGRPFCRLTNRDERPPDLALFFWRGRPILDLAGSHVDHQFGGLREVPRAFGSLGHVRGFGCGLRLPSKLLPIYEHPGCCSKCSKWATAGGLILALCALSRP